MIAVPGAAPRTRVETGEPAIETRGLTKRYGDVLAVDHLTIEVERGEIFGFLGPNGAGKTTTMRMLLGLIRPSAGSARILGMDISVNLRPILARTGSIIENPTFFPHLSGRDNLRLVARLTETPESRVPAILDLMDLQAAAHRSFKTYSLGMKQRLAVGAALLADPDLLILDEPANGLDPAGIVEMRDLMQRLKGEGRTVLISSHVLHEVEHICDRVAIMNHGRVAAKGRVEDLLGVPDRMEIRIERAAEVKEVLARVPWISQVRSDGARVLVTSPLDRAADINRLLAGHGFYASFILPCQASLEEYFLDITEGDAT